MDNKTIYLITFSPTQTTRKIVERVARGLGPNNIEELDLTSPQARTANFDKLETGLAIIGAPVYAGRIPPECVRRLRRVHAKGVPAVIVVLYGNREYDDALVELRDLAAEAGFHPIAGAAFIGEHSYSSEDKPIAAGRPDSDDLKCAEEFGKEVAQLLETGQPELVQVPGNVPYKEYRGPSGVSPDTDHDLCSLCGSCIEICPAAAIRITETLETDKTLCLLCNACAKNCPNAARFVEVPRVKEVTEWLYRNCQNRKEPEYFLGKLSL